MSMMAQNLQNFLMVYFFPVQFTIGIVGNTLNLIVLLNKRMRTKTNVLLAILALADIFFLVFMLPLSLIYHPNVIKKHEVRVFFVYASQHIAGLINLCSFISAWLIVLLSVERMSAVLWPLKARLFWTYKTLRFFVCVLIISSILVSMHFHLTHTVTVIMRNHKVHNATTGMDVMVERPVLRSMLRKGWEDYWKVSTCIDIFLLVLIPVLCVVCSNIGIVCSLHKHNKKHPSVVEKESLTNGLQNELLNSGRHSSLNNSVRSQRRATFIVVIIASSFTICQIPSAVVHICEIIYPNISFHSEFRTAATLTNSLVITTKTMNLFLFCMWSANFRKNLVRIIMAELETCTVRLLKDARWRRTTKGESKTKVGLNYSDPVVLNAANKRSYPSTMGTPALLRHSLPVNIDYNKVALMGKSDEQNVLLK